MASASQQHVQWLGLREAPSQLSAQLKARGLAVTRVGVLAPTTPARLTRLGEGASVERPSLTGRRVAVLHPDPGGADEQAQALRGRGATVAVLSLNPDALARFQSFDPDAVLVQEADFIGGCWEVIRALWNEPRLRWTPVLLGPVETIGKDKRPAQTDAVCQAIQELCAPYDLLVKQAGSGRDFEVPLNRLGPARTLRALAASGAELEVRVESGEDVVELRLSGQLVADAIELPAPVDEQSDRVRAVRALSRVLAVDHGRVLVKAAAAAALHNFKIPLDELPKEAHPTRSVTASGMVRRGLPGPSEAARRAVPSPPLPGAGGTCPGSEQVGRASNEGRVYPLRPAVVPRLPENESTAAESGAAVPPRLAVSKKVNDKAELSDIWEPIERQSLYQAEQAYFASASAVSTLGTWGEKSRERVMQLVSKLKFSVDDCESWIRSAQRRARRMSPLAIILTVSAVIALLPLLAVVFGGPDKARPPLQLTVRTERASRAMPPSARAAAERTPSKGIRLESASAQVDIAAAVPARPAEPKATSVEAPSVPSQTDMIVEDSEAQPRKAEGPRRARRSKAKSDDGEVHSRDRRRSRDRAHTRPQEGDSRVALRHARAVMHARAGREGTTASTNTRKARSAAKHSNARTKQRRER